MCIEHRRQAVFLWNQLSGLLATRDPLIWAAFRGVRDRLANYCRRKINGRQPVVIALITRAADVKIAPQCFRQAMAI